MCQLIESYHVELYDINCQEFFKKFIKYNFKDTNRRPLGQASSSSTADITVLKYPDVASRVQKQKQIC